MNRTKKVLFLTLCAVLIVAASVFGTLAYLTDRDAVKNTFSVGSVEITMDETAVTLYGEEDTAATKRVIENEYRLVPGYTYIKDPVIHVDKDSESCYLFVEVDNVIQAYESTDDDYDTIAKQLENNGWQPLEGVEKVYWNTYTKGQTDKDIKVFEEFKIDGLANDKDGWDEAVATPITLTVTGYAVQQDSLASAKAAWDATFAQEDDAVVVTNAEEFEAALKAGGTVKLGASFSYSHMSNPYDLTSDIVLDLNGQTLSVNGVFYAYRNMTIMDNQGGGTLSAANIWAQDGEIKITGGTYSCALAGSSSYTITGGTFYGSLGMSSATITGGKFRSNPTRFVNTDTHTVTNSDGWYTVTAK